MAQKPHWPTDLSLTTHVFQFQDRYHEDLIGERLAATLDYAWGISELEWDVRALGSGQVALKHVRAIMPDGTPVALDARESQACAPRSARELKPDGSLLIYLGIPRVGPRLTGDDLIAARYVRERVLVPDFANGSEPVELEWLRPKLGLYLEGERLEALTTLPCARVVRAGAGGIGFDPTFVPPVLTVAASGYLDLELRRAFDLLAARRLALRRAPARDGSDGSRQWLMSLLGSLMPRLADAIERHAHPHHAYLVLAEIVGSLSAFTPIGDIKVPPFNFDHLGPLFSELFGALRAVMAALGAEQYQRIPLQPTDATTLYADLKEPGIFRRDFYVGVVGDDVDRLRDEVPRVFKLAARGDLARVIGTHSKGVTLRAEHVAPAALPDVPGVVYFAVAKDEAFTPVYKTGELGIHHAGMKGVRDIGLYLVEPAEK